MTTEETLAYFEELLKRTQVQYHLFFSGHRKTPPLEDRKRLERLVQEFAKMRIRDNGVRFRWGTLLGRFNQFSELWNRQMREREEGPISFQRRMQAYDEADEAIHAHDAELQKPAPAPPTVTSEGADSYVQVSAANGDAAMERLYAQLAEANRKLGKAPMSQSQLSAMIQKQVESLREKYGVDSVAFRFEIVDDKVKLKAKPIQAK